MVMRIHVLLFDAGSDSEGIHSLEITGRTVVLLFENPDDAERYAALLEAQDFPVPTVEELDRKEIEQFCREVGYETHFIPSGFVPSTDEERLFMAPPQTNRDVTNWKDSANPTVAEVDPSSEAATDMMVESNLELESLRQQLEDLL